MYLTSAFLLGCRKEAMEVTLVTWKINGITTSRYLCMARQLHKNCHVAIYLSTNRCFAIKIEATL